MNDKFLTCTGKCGIDFNQITRVEKGYNNGTFLVCLFTKYEKYPVITLICEKEDAASRLYNNIKIIIYNNQVYGKQTKGEVINLADYRKD